MNILHLLSWFPTPDDPTLGNFCLRQINALPDDCHSVILSVCDGKDLKQSFEIHEIKGKGTRTFKLPSGRQKTIFCAKSRC